MKDIPGFKGYKIDENSVVYSVHIKKVMKVKVNNGYLSIGLFKDGKYHYVNCHRLAAMTFLGIPDNFEKMDARHLDGNKSNNHISNIALGTKAENAQDKFRHGTAYNLPKGEDHHNAKLTDDLVGILREEAETTNCVELSKKYNIPHITIYDAVVGKSWKHLNERYKPVDLSGRQYVRKKDNLNHQNG